jgi:hypothetical protein
MSIYKTLTREELPDNLQQLEVLEVHQLINGKQVKIDPRRVKINDAVRAVKLDICIATPENKE